MNSASVHAFAWPCVSTRTFATSAVGTDAAEVLPLFFGGDLSTKRREHIVGSPLFWANPNAASTLIVHGTKDDHVAYEQATWMVERLKACMVEVVLLTLEGAGHGFKGPDAEKAEAAMVAFFDKHLKPQAK